MCAASLLGSVVLCPVAGGFIGLTEFITVFTGVERCGCGGVGIGVLIVGRAALRVEVHVNGGMK